MSRMEGLWLGAGLLYSSLPTIWSPRQLLTAPSSEPQPLNRGGERPILCLQWGCRSEKPTVTAHSGPWRYVWPFRKQPSRSSRASTIQSKAYMMGEETGKSRTRKLAAWENVSAEPSSTDSAFLEGSGSGFSLIVLHNPHGCQLLMTQHLQSRFYSERTHTCDTTALDANETCAPASSALTCSAPLRQYVLMTSCLIIPVGTTRPWQTHWLHLTSLSTSALVFPKPSFKDIPTEEKTFHSSTKAPGPSMPCFLSAWYSNFNISLIFKVAISTIAVEPRKDHHSPRTSWCGSLQWCGQLPWICFVSYLTRVWRTQFLLQLLRGSC